MALNPTELKRLKDAFNEWAKNHPTPDEPAVGFVGTKLYSAKEMAKEVENETDVGKSLLDILEYGARVVGIEQVIKDFTQKPPQP